MIPQGVGRKRGKAGRIFKNNGKNFIDSSMEKGE
jgi:hypothetical protein